MSRELPGRDASPVPPDIAPEAVLEHLSTRRFGRSLVVLGETGSTNDDARAAADVGAADGHVVVADTQRRGRGSRGHAWSSPPGVDLYFSIVSRSRLQLAELPPVTLATGLGVADAVSALTTGHRVDIDWPNDVRLDGRKVAGVLVETHSVGYAATNPAPATAIIGVGINVNRRTFAGPLGGSATSIALALGAEARRAPLLADALCRIEGWLDRLVHEGVSSIVPELSLRLAHVGERVRCGAVEGELLGVSPAGALRIAGPSGVREILTGRLEACVRL